MNAATDPDDEVRQAFRKHVAEVASGAVELVSIARNLGDQVLVAVRSRDDTVHPVAVCSYHLRNIVRELGEKVSTVLWSDKPESFIVNALQPFGPSPSPTPQVTLDAGSHVAEVAVSRETLTFLTEHGGSRAPLASKLVGWDIRLVSHGHT